MKEIVLVVKCASYRKEEVRDAVGKMMDMSGISPGSFPKLLFKPNMLSARLPEEGVTTHPAVLEEAVLYFESPVKLIGDSPANSLKPIPLYWERCGFQKVSEKTGAALVKFGSSFFAEVKTAGGIKARVPVTDFLKDYALVNVAKLKTHGLTVLTSAVKNLYGLIPGYHKSVLHSRFVSPLDFSEFIADYYRAVNSYVAFNIVDAVVSMEGSGPSSGKLRNTGYIIGGRNAAAVDTVCCRLLGIQEKNVPHLRIYGEKYGLPDVEARGDALIPAKHFAVPGKRLHSLMSKRMVKPLLKTAAKYFKITPVIEPLKCKKCYACVQVCPVQAISGDLTFDRTKCINCLCCFEVCPYRAIEIKKSFVARIFT